MILSKVTNKFVLFQKIPLLIKRHVYSINVKAFSLIEMLVAMMVISKTFLIERVVAMMVISKTFLIESRELTTVDFEFFSRDILEDFKGVDRNDIEIRQQRIILHKGEEMIEYKLINNKIIKVVNDRGNITLINNVTAFTANIYYKSIIKITITVKVGTNLQTKTIYV
ncbi:prepilin-type N-terminal cleavage/methylation domain-containing protein [Staphylococcus aureus]|nr:prepilin-type N-terminal cleavage/methylation domain-containing protein [Staphylococcus aureus]